MIELPARREGFTLIELLVVVAIVAILAALLMPALKSAREQGKAAQCLNNHRQLVLGIALCADDNNGQLPSYYYGTTITNNFGAYSWPYQVAPYLFKNQTFIRTRLACPSARLSSEANWSVGVHAKRIFATWELDGNKSMYLPALPGNTLLTADGVDSNVGIILGPREYPFEPSGSDYDGDGVKDTGISLAPIRIYNGLRFWHQNRAVVGCADGSARLVTLTQWLKNDEGLWGP